MAAKITVGRILQRKDWRLSPQTTGRECYDGTPVAPGAKRKNTK